MSIIFIVLIEDWSIFVCLILLASEKFPKVTTVDKLRDTIMMQDSVVLSLWEGDSRSWGKERTKSCIWYQFLQPLLYSSTSCLEVISEDTEVTAHRIIDIAQNLLLTRCYLLSNLFVICYI